MSDDSELDAASLVLAQRWAALGTLEDGGPSVTMVAYAAAPDLSGLFLHLSGLARHTKNLLDDPRASLALGRPDSGEGDPQELPRVSLRGEAFPVDEATPEWDALRRFYISRFPAAEARFDLGNFFLFQFRPEQASFVGGLGRARRITADGLSKAARSLASAKQQR